jgi:DNA-binding response OmpR family regulator
MNMHNPYIAEIAKLRRELDDAKAQISYLTATRTPFDSTLRRMYGFTAGQVRMLVCLAHGGTKTRVQLARAYGGSIENSERNVDSQVKRIRTLVRRKDGDQMKFNIDPVYGEGYELWDESLAFVREHTKGMRGQ